MHSREITAQAFDWVVRLERGLNQDEQSQLERWLALDARCVGALARAQAYWVHVDAVRDFSDAQKLQLRSATSGYSIHRVGWAAAAAILVAVGFLALRQTSNTIEALTAMGEIRRMPLADGSAIAYGFTTKFDGKATPITGSIPNGADNVSATKTDDHHYVATLKKGDKLIGTSKVTISEDGKVTTVDATGVTATGAKSHDVQVYDKQ